MELSLDSLRTPTAGDLIQRNSTGRKKAAAYIDILRWLFAMENIPAWYDD